MTVIMVVTSVPFVSFAVENGEEAPATNEQSVQESEEAESSIQNKDAKRGAQEEGADSDSQNVITRKGVQAAGEDSGTQDVADGDDAQGTDADNTAQDAVAEKGAQDNDADADNAAQDSDAVNGAKNGTRGVPDDAIQVSSWDDLYNACQNAPDNVSTLIVLSDNITRNWDSDYDRIEIDENKVIVLDLNGKTLDADRSSDTSSAEKYYHVLDVHEGGDLTLKDSSGDNSGTVKGGDAYNGGGIYISEGGTCRIEGGTIGRNLAHDKGGGIYTEGTLIMTGGVIGNNDACFVGYDNEHGGGIYCSKSGKIQLQNVRIIENMSGHFGSGIMVVLGNNDSYIRNCEIIKNGNGESFAFGGGIYVDADIKDRTLEITDTTIAENKGYCFGGGIYLKKGTIQMVNGSIAENKAMTRGNADYDHLVGAGVYVDTDQTWFMAESVTIENNSCTSKGAGGGIYNNKGTVGLTNCTVKNNTAQDFGGGIYDAKNQGRLNLTDTEVTNNSSGVGGGIYFADEGGTREAMIIGGNTVVSDNTASDVYLPGKMVISISGNNPLGSGANIGITYPDVPGIFTSDFERYMGESATPDTYFFSNEGHLVTKQDGNGYIALDLDEAHKFLNRNERVNTNVNSLGPTNWMSGVSGERYLNEINIPGTHDTAMRDPSSFGCLAGKFGAAQAQTQKEYFFEQLENGARFFDLRLKTYYCEDEIDVGMLALLGAGITAFIPVVGPYAAGTLATIGIATEINDSALPIYKDDGENLWACHGRSAAGTFYAMDQNGNTISFAQELEWMKEYLRKHPTETIIIDVRPETDKSDGDSYYGPLERLKGILEEESTDINPSTEESYFYWEDGIVGKKFEQWPQLKDCRGKIVIFGGKGEKITDTVGGFYKNTDGVESESGKGGFQDGAARGENIKEFLETQNQLQIPRDAMNDQMKDFYWVKMNTTDTMFIETPVELADRYVLPVILGSDGLVNESQKGRYFGWFSMDAARTVQYRNVWITNFPNDLDYCTITVKSGLSGENAPVDQVYKVLRGSTITIPGCIYDGDQADYFKGWKADVDNETYIKNNKYRVLENVTFTAQWSNDLQTPVTVEWKDADDLDGLRPTQLTITYNSSYTETIKAEEDWTIMLSGDLTSNPSVNTVTGYNSKVEGSKGKDGYTITMTHTPEVSVNASGTITWNDDNDKDGIRPDSVTLKLYKNGEETPIATGTATAEGNWKFNLGTFPRYENGELVAYRLVEEEISFDEDLSNSGYTNGVEAIEGEKKAITGFKVTNTHEVTTTVMYAQIDWDDDDDAAGERPESVTVQWLKDGEPYGEPIVVNQDEENEGKWIVGLELTYAEIKALGQEQDAIARKYKAGEMTEEEFVEAIEKTISYSIRQDKIDNYTTTVTIKKIEGDDGEETGSYYQILNTYEKHEHDWEFVDFTWIEDENDPNIYTGVVANYKCKNDAEHTQTVDAEVTTEVTDPTCEEAGKTVLTATVSKEASLDGEARTDSKTIPIPALGHDWGEWVVTKEATETEEGSETRTCKNDPSHTETRAIPASIAYRNVFGDGNIWYKGSKDTSDFGFKRSIDDASTISHFTGILVDGKTVDSADYTKESGSVIVKLKPEYLETLSLGEHKLTAQFDDGNGSATADFTIAEKDKDESGYDDDTDAVVDDDGGSDSSKGARTGDESPIVLWVFLLAASLAAVILLTLTRSKLRRKDR